MLFLCHSGGGVYAETEEIQAYRNVIEYYLSTGKYYVETDPTFVTAASGNQDWPRTVKEQMPLVQRKAVMNKPLLPAGADALPEHRPVKYDYAPQSVMMVAEEPVPYGTKKDDH